MEWRDVYLPILQMERMVKFKDVIKNERIKYKVLPEGPEVFNAFKAFNYDDLKVVIVGQDPYPNRDHPHGMAFSTLSKERPKSLHNIFLEIRNELYPEQDMNELFKTNNLTCWAKQGVLLLNRCLTVREGDSNSHKGLGWEYLTDGVIGHISKEYPRNVVFVLWGKDAQAVESLIDSRHLVLKSAHPSPLSANNGFFGNGHFIRIQEFLREQFFKSLHEMMENSAEVTDFAKYTVEWFRQNKIELSQANAENVLKFVIGRIGEIITLADPELKKFYEINFRTDEYELQKT